jgi:hypothetical protein
MLHTIALRISWSFCHHPSRFHRPTKVRRHCFICRNGDSEVRKPPDMFVSHGSHGFVRVWLTCLSFLANIPPSCCNECKRSEFGNAETFPGTAWIIITRATFSPLALYGRSHCRLGGVVVSVLATGPNGCGFEPGQGDGF